MERDDNSNNAAENSLEDAVETAVNKLVFSNDFSKYITKYKDFKNNNTTEKFTTKLLITKPKGLNKNGKFLPEASKSVVTIIRKDSHGSGSIISPDGYILTNAHVCGSDSILKIRFKNGDETDAKLVRMNVDEDLALLKFDNKNKIDGLVMAFGISEVAVADEIYVIGTPADLSLNQSISRGLISGDRIIKNKKLYQTDAAINGGNSGGAMLDANGILIGIPSSKIKGTGLEGLGFAIPSGTAIEFLKLGYK
jgi:S1-C subfamily serine protease